MDLTTGIEQTLTIDQSWRCRCVACRMPLPLCLCRDVPVLPELVTVARLTFVVHAKEWKRLSNTARLLHLVYRRNGGTCDVFKHGGIQGTADIDQLTDDGRTFILFPGQRSRVMTDADLAALPRPPRIIVPDGTWGQANKIMKRVPALARLPVFALPRPPSDASRMRRNVFADRMSTFEAAAQAVGLFAGHDTEAALTDFLRRAADRMLLMRGRLKADEVHGGIPPSSHALI